MRSCAFLVMCALAAASYSVRAAGTRFIGVVMQCKRSHVGTGVLSVGATLYDNDRLSTDEPGQLQFRGQSAQIQLEANSSLTLRGASDSIIAEFERGTLTFWADRAASIEVVALKVHIRPLRNVQTVAQISFGNTGLEISAFSGDLEISFDGTTNTLQEGRKGVVLNSTEKDNHPFSSQGPKPPARRPRGYYTVPIAVNAVLLPIIIHKALESPDRP